jgi:hypothetical protein
MNYSNLQASEMKFLLAKKKTKVGMKVWTGVAEYAQH